MSEYKKGYYLFVHSGQMAQVFEIRIIKVTKTSYLVVQDTQLPCIGKPKWWIKKVFHNTYDLLEII